MPTDNNTCATRREALKWTGGTGVALSTLLAGCLEDDDPDGYTIGMLNSQTGTLAPYGERNERGLELALEEINDVGLGPDDEELNVIVEDTESESGPGVDAAQKLANQDQVPFIVGAVSSGVTVAVYDSVVSATDAVQVSPSSTAANMTERPDLLRTCPTQDGMGRVLADLIAEEDHDSVAVTWINNDYGQGLSEVFESVFEGTVEYNEPHDQGEASYDGVLSEMASSDATAWLFLTYAEEMAIMANDAYDQGYHEEVQYFGAESTLADDVLENSADGSLEGMRGATESAPLDEPAYEEYRDRFEAEYDEEPTVWSTYNYDAVMIAALAIEAADEFTGEALMDVVRDVTREPGEEVHTFEEAKTLLDEEGVDGVNFHGTSGPLNMDENGDVDGYYQLWSVEDHEYHYDDFVAE